MGERMPACHYYPPDFDPDKTGRRCKPKNGQHQVRFMLPFAIQCNECGDYMFQGTKCNCRKEICYNDFYLGNTVYRLYLHCKSCYAEITIRTDPKNLDYLVEKGATRHFEPWRDLQISSALDDKKRMLGNSIQQAEASTIDTQREMDQLRELERLRATSKKQDNANLEKMLKSTQENNLESRLTDEDKIKIDNFEREKQKSIKSSTQFLPTLISSNAFTKSKKSLLAYDDDDDDDDDEI